MNEGCGQCGGSDPRTAEVTRMSTRYMDPRPDQALVAEILAELHRARAKYPAEGNVTSLALAAEHGELAQALLRESRARVRQEAVQVAAMAMRIVLDGDQTLDDWRERQGLDGLTNTQETIK